MGYMHIDNLYKDTRVLMFKEVFALEKVHGTSAHIQFKDGTVTFYSGGAKYSTFCELFDTEELYAAFMELGHNNVTVYGEAYGGKIQKMSYLYGENMRFIVFDVKIGDTWLDVPNAEDVAAKLNLEFVPYVKMATELSLLDEERDGYSEIGKRLGLEGIREGIVIRPMCECTRSDGKRIMAKHKGAAFTETETVREVDPDKIKVMADAEQVAGEWVTDVRLAHVMDAIEADYMLVNSEEKEWGIEDTGAVISRMVADIKREGEAEVEMGKAENKCIAQRTAKIYHAWLNETLAEVTEE